MPCGDSEFTRWSWLVKKLSGNTKDPKERKLDLKLNSVRVVTKNTFVILNGRWKILDKKNRGNNITKQFRIVYIVIILVEV